MHKRYGIRFMVYHLLLAAFLAPFSTSVTAATIYECRGYDGTNFLSNNYCSQSNGVEITTYAVPSNMSFDEQVAIAREAKGKARAAERSQTAAANKRQAEIDSARRSKELQCQQLDRAIRVKDSELRQPHSAQYGDYLTGKRKELTDQRFSLGC